MSIPAYFRNLRRALLGADAEIMSELRAITRRQNVMSAQSDRLTQSIATLNATINDVVVPALGSPATAPTDGDADALFASAADAVDAANQTLLTAANHPAANPASVETAPATETPAA